MNQLTPGMQFPDPKQDTKSSGWVFRTLFILALASTLLVAVVGAAIYYAFSRDLPQIITVADYRPRTVTRIFAAKQAITPAIPTAPGATPAPMIKEGTLVGEYYTERRYVVPYEKIPEAVVRAFISAEDDKFFEHQGINLASIIRASIANFRAGHVVQGGSTITQQVAKSLLLTPERSFSRKIKEVILASRLEQALTKQQILYLYLNQIYLGHGAYGVQAASLSYFHKDVSDVTLAEAAILAGMPQAPGKYSPLLNAKRAKERQLYVLRRLYENGYITQPQMAEAAAQKIKIFDDDEVNGKYGPYLVEHIRRYLVEKYGEEAVNEQGITVYLPTTAELMIAARKSLQDGIRQIDKRIGYRGPIKKLKSIDEVEQLLRDQRIELIKKRLGYLAFMPDGRLDPLESIQMAGFKTDADLLEPGEVYQAIVTSVDDRAKTAGVMVGAIRAELPYAELKWAKPARDDKSPAWRPEPKSVSQVVAKNDLVWVHLVKKEGGHVIVGLDQIPQVQGALFSMQAQTGYVLAMEGGYDYATSQFNRAIQAQRQPGSAFKPIIYSAALQKGFTPASIIVDSPIVYEDADQGKWKPSNFEEKFYGDTTFRQALIKSRNVPTIKIVQAIQVPFVIDFARKLGMTGQFNPDLSISLGSATVNLVELTRVYSLFPRLGRKLDPIFYTTIKDRDGKVLEELQAEPAPLPKSIPAADATPVAQATPGAAQTAPAAPTSKIAFPTYPRPEDPGQLMDPRVAYVMTNIMKDVVNYGTGHEAKSLGRVSAGKTGTTNDFIDAWFMGFTPQIVTGTWVGFDNLRSIGPNETGARAALPIWLSFMREAVKNSPDEDFNVPPGVIIATVDPNTGKLASPNSSNAIKEAFIEGTEPTETSSNSTGNSDSSGEFLKEDIE